MKRLLTIAAVLIGMAGAGAGQYPIYKTLPGDSTLVRIKPKYDTIPIIYLYCDTTEYGFNYDTLTNGWIRINEKNVYWDFGYEVREMEWVENYWESCEIPGSLVACVTLVPAHYRLKKHIGYLDRHKQPIRKSIVLFMTKTIEK